MTRDTQEGQTQKPIDESNQDESRRVNYPDAAKR